MTSTFYQSLPLTLERNLASIAMFLFSVTVSITILSQKVSIFTSTPSLILLSHFIPYFAKSHFTFCVVTSPKYTLLSPYSHLLILFYLAVVPPPTAHSTLHLIIHLNHLVPDFLAHNKQLKFRSLFPDIPPTPLQPCIPNLLPTPPTFPTSIHPLLYHTTQHNLFTTQTTYLLPLAQRHIHSHPTYKPSFTLQSVFNSKPLSPPNPLLFPIPSLTHPSLLSINPPTQSNLLSPFLLISHSI